MPHRPDTLCAGGCGRLLWSSTTSLPPGQRKCRPCRRAESASRPPRPSRPERRGTLHCSDCATPIIDRPPQARLCLPCKAERSRERLSRKNHERRIARTAICEDVDRLVVFERDDWRCQLCGKKVQRSKRWPHPQSPSVDHVVPLSEGGSHTYANVQCSHLTCNLSKGTGGSQQLRLLG